ncbi:hypothetical protein OIU74_029690 [Salix koriyanagi]|uniref:Uncharacterized protein n=1 Tax=Salix koriyanagi TaxID=2511006 RepID=A0A9Q0ZUC0_9ROSI|nr:hypothetical protein OIU74_029690 [Salix koriyanagi]
MRRLARSSRNVLWISVPFLPRVLLPPPPPESSIIRVERCLTPPSSGALLVRGTAQETGMNWWHKMRKAWFVISSRVKFHKAGPGGGRGGATSRSAGGLLKLQDDVQMCGYKDVEVMWNMFIESNRQQMAAAVVASASKPTSNQNHRPSSLRSFFWCHNSATRTTTSFTSLNQVLITTAEKDTEITEG